MKYRLKWLSILIIVMVTASCSEEGFRNIEPSDTAAVEEQAVVISFAHKSINSYFYTIMNEAVKRAVEDNGWTFNNSVADYDPVRQNQQIINFIEQEPNAIITTAIDSIAIEEVIHVANDADIPVCTIDTTAVGGQLAIDVSFDNYHAGELAAEVIVEKLIEKYESPKGLVYNGYGDLSSSAWRLRKEGFESVIMQYPDIDYMPIATEGKPALVKETLLDLIQSGVIPDAVHTPSEHPARGLVEALEETGRWYQVGEEEHVILVTIDAEPYFVNLVNKGYADGAISQDVIAYANITIDLLERYVFPNKVLPEGDYLMSDTYWKVCKIAVNQGKAKITIPAYIIDLDNSDDERHWAHIAEELWGFQYNK